MCACRMVPCVCDNCAACNTAPCSCADLSPAVRAFLVTLSCEAGGQLPPYGMATIPGPRQSTAVVPQSLAVPLWLGLRDLMQETTA